MSKVLETSNSIQLDFNAVATLMLLLLFQRGSKECVNFKTGSLIISVTELLKYAVHGYLDS